MPCRPTRCGGSLRELQSRIDGNGLSQPAPAPAHPGQDAEETAFDVASRAGLIGCIKGAPRSPTDLSTNPKHMEGFGRRSRAVPEP